MLYQNNELFLFNEKTRLQGAINQHQVIIQPIDVNNVGQTFDNDRPYVAGFLKGNFTYSVGADWQPIPDAQQGIGGLLSQASTFTGSPVFASGIFKRKFYQGGGYISFNIEFRMVSDKTYRTDETVNGEIKNPKAAAHFLAALCLPSPDPVGRFVGELLSEGVLKVEQAEEIWNHVRSGNTTDAITTVTNIAKKTGGDVAKRFNSIYQGVATAFESPYPRSVRVKIGNYFDSYDMILEDVTATYSRESIYGDPAVSRRFGHGNTGDDRDVTNADNNLQAYQPLYVDFTLKVSTRTIPVSDEGNANTGLLSTQPSVSVKSELNNFVNGVTGEKR